MKKSMYILYVTITRIEPGKITYSLPYALQTEGAHRYKCAYPEQDFAGLISKIAVGKTYRIVTRHLPQFVDRSVWIWEEVKPVDAGAIDYEADTAFVEQKLRAYEMRKWYDSRPAGWLSSRKPPTPSLSRARTGSLADMFQVE